MPDKVTVTPASGKLEFFNDDGTVDDCGNTTTIQSINIIKLTKIRI